MQGRVVGRLCALAWVAFVLAFASSAYGQSLWPSVKTCNEQTSGVGDVAWLTSHYDFIESIDDYPPISQWFDGNPNIGSGFYQDWLMMCLAKSPSLTENWASTPPGNLGTGDSGVGSAAVWYDYCARNGIDWEQGFYHLGTADTYIDDTVTDTTVDSKIRYVMRNTDARGSTEAAYNGTAGLALTSLGDVVYFGRPDRFSEVNLVFSTVAKSGWVGVWEYWNGSAWTPVSPSSDATNGCTQNGKVSFAPPPTAAQWKRTTVNGQPVDWGPSGVYFLRLRCSAVGGGGPTIAQARGRAYIVYNGTAGGTIPAWDPANDVDGDGYAEASVNPAATAKFAYEARIPWYYPNTNWGLFAANISNATYRAVRPGLAYGTLDYFAAQAGGHKMTGVGLDTWDGGSDLMPPAVQTRIIELPATSAADCLTKWQTDLATLTQVAQTAAHSRGYLLGGNTGGMGLAAVNQYLDFFDMESFAGAGNAAVGGYKSWESEIWPATAQWQVMSDAGKLARFQWALALYQWMRASGETITLTQGSTTVTGVSTSWLEDLDPGSVFVVDNGGSFYTVASVQSNTSCTLTAAYQGTTRTTSFTAVSARDKVLGLAAFMALQKPSSDYFSTWWSYAYPGTWSPYLNWTPAAAVDFGQPTGVVPAGKSPRGTRGAYVYQTGTDPVSGNTYYVYARDYTNGMVLFRPTADATHTVSSFQSGSAVTVALPTAMDPVDYFGRVGSAVTSVSLRNAEGALFVKSAPSSAPLRLEVSVDHITAAPGDTVVYTVTCANVSTQAVQGITVSDLLPSAVTYVTGTTTLNGVAVTPDPVSGGNLSLNIGTLAAGQTAVVTFAAVVN